MPPIDPIDPSKLEKDRLQRKQDMMSVQKQLIDKFTAEFDRLANELSLRLDQQHEVWPSRTDLSTSTPYYARTVSPLLGDDRLADQLTDVFIALTGYERHRVKIWFQKVPTYSGGECMLVCVSYDVPYANSSNNPD